MLDGIADAEEDTRADHHPEAHHRDVKERELARKLRSQRRVTAARLDTGLRWSATVGH
jgi:hypothetical protein